MKVIRGETTWYKYETLQALSQKQPGSFDRSWLTSRHKHHMSGPCVAEQLEHDTGMVLQVH